MKVYNHSKRVQEALIYWQNQLDLGNNTAQAKIAEIKGINPVKPWGK